ncbi:MAG: hypothetical protein QXP42_02695 [Candidatus Micrarchaeia archaeon]
MKGLVLLSEEQDKRSVSYITDGRRLYRLNTERLEEGASVELEKKSGNFVIKRVLEESYLPQYYTKIHAYKGKDSVIRALRKKMEPIAREILLSVFSLKQIHVRFHEDADGACAALCIRGAIVNRAAAYGYDEQLINKMFRFEQIGSAIYTEHDAFHDLPKSSRSSIFLLLDFASNEESRYGIQILKRAGMRVGVIDHHPPPWDSNFEKLLGVDFFISPWACGGDSSHTAGVICGELGKMLGAKGLAELQKISVAGDRSSLIKFSEKHKNSALLLDFALSKKMSLLTCAEALNNPQVFSPLLSEAKLVLEEALEEALAKTQVFSTGAFTLAVIAIDKLATRPFPKKSLLCTLIHEKIGKNAITVGYGKKLFIIRVSEEAVKNGFDANRFVSDAKNEFRDIIIAGGGHSKAASIRLTGSSQCIMEHLKKTLIRLTTSK